MPAINMFASGFGKELIRLSLSCRNGRKQLMRKAKELEVFAVCLLYGFSFYASLNFKNAGIRVKTPGLVAGL